MEHVDDLDLCGDHMHDDSSNEGFFRWCLGTTSSAIWVSLDTTMIENFLKSEDESNLLLVS